MCQDALLLTCILTIVLRFFFFFHISQICRVEDITVSGIVRGSIIHIHRARTVTIANDGMISASELGDSMFWCHNYYLVKVLRYAIFVT